MGMNCEQRHLWRAWLPNEQSARVAHEGQSIPGLEQAHSVHIPVI